MFVTKKPLISKKTLGVQHNLYFEYKYMYDFHQWRLFVTCKVFIESAQRSWATILWKAEFEQNNAVLCLGVGRYV